MSISSTHRTAAVVGAGQAGATAALGLLDAGFDVTVYSERDQRALRDDVPPTGTALVFGRAQQAETTLGLDTYLDRAPHHEGLSARVTAPGGAEVIEFDATFAGFAGVAVDTRLKADERLTTFRERGGRFVVEAVTPERLDAIAAATDLTIVATGRTGLTDLFPVDAARTPYDRPQRTLISLIATGLPHTPDVFSHRGTAGGTHSAFSVLADQGEGWWGPFLHKDIGPAWSFIGWARPGTEWERLIATADSPETALAAVQRFYRDHADWDLAEVSALRPIIEDRRSWLKGAIRPLVRAGVATTASGHAVAALGDAAATYDPIGGQGAQTGLVQAAGLVAAAAAHDGPFDEAWIAARYAEHLAGRGDGAMRFTRLFLGDPELAAIGERFFATAAVSPTFASGLMELINNPVTLLDVADGDAAARFVRSVTGEDPDELLARFAPAGRFDRSRYAPVPA